jgi:hypothetical protein
MIRLTIRIKEVTPTSPSPGYGRLASISTSLWRKSESLRKWITEEFFGEHRDCGLDIEVFEKSVWDYVLESLWWEKDLYTIKVNGITVFVEDVDLETWMSFWNRYWEARQ